MRIGFFPQICLRSSITALAVLLFSACTLRPHSSQVPSGAVLLPPQESTRALEVVRQQSAAVRTFKALSDTSIFYGDEQSTLRYVFAFEGPDKLRIEALPLNGFYTLSLFVAAEGRALLLDPAEKKAETGAFEAPLIRKMLRLPLSGRDLPSLIAGRVAADILGAGNFKVYAALNSEKLYFLSADERYYFICGRLSGLPEYFEIRDPFRGGLALAVSYSDWRNFGGFDIPVALKVHAAGDDMDLDLSLSNVAVNQVLPARLFKVDIPASYRIVNLD